MSARDYFAGRKGLHSDLQRELEQAKTALLAARTPARRRIALRRLEELRARGIR